MLVRFTIALCLCFAPGAGAEEPPVQRETIEVLGLTPVEGIGLDAAKFPTNAQKLTRSSSEFTRDLQSGTSLSLQDPQGGLLQSDLLSLGTSIRLASRAQVSADLRGASEQYVRGDEANLARPLAGYAVTDLRLDYDLSTRARLTLGVRNLFDERYATFGLLGEADEVLGEEYEDSSRFLTPAAPRSFVVGVEIRM